MADKVLLFTYHNLLCSLAPWVGRFFYPCSSSRVRKNSIFTRKLHKSSVTPTARTGLRDAMPRPLSRLTRNLSSIKEPPSWHNMWGFRSVIYQTSTRQRAKDGMKGSVHVHIHF